MDEAYVLEDIFSVNVRVLAGVSLLLAFIIGIVGNLVVLCVIIATLGKKKNIPNILILVLTTVDILLVTVTYVQPLTTYLHGKYIGGYLVCNIHASVVLFFNSMSIIVVISMAIDRYFAVSRPYCYQEKMVSTATKIIIFILVNMTISAAISIPPFLGFGTNTLYYPGTYCMFTLQPTNDRDRTMLMGYLIAFTIMILLVIVANIGGSISVYEMISFRTRYSTSQSADQTDSEEYLFLRLSIVTMATFLILWFPLYVCLCISLSKTEYPEWYGMLSIRLAALQGVINPWLHPILRRKFRRSFCWMFHSTISYLTCKLVTPPQDTLDFILSGETRTNNKIQLENINEMSGNVLFDLAQRNIVDYVDALGGTKTAEEHDEIFDIEMNNVSKDDVMSSEDALDTKF